MPLSSGPLPLLGVSVLAVLAIGVTVAWTTVTERQAVLRHAAGVDQRHHILVPGLGGAWGRPRAGIGEGPGSGDAGRGAPDGQPHGDGGPVEAVLLQLTVVHARVTGLSSANQNASIHDHQQIT